MKVTTISRAAVLDIVRELPDGMANNDYRDPADIVGWLIAELETLQSYEFDESEIVRGNVRVQYFD